MHTLVEDLGTKEDLPFTCIKLFEDGSISHAQAEDIYTALHTEGCTKGEILSLIKRKLPEGFLQTRMWCMSYKTLKNIIDQRSSHSLPHWQAFCESVKAQIDHPEFIFD